MFYGEDDRKLDYKGRLGIPEDLLSLLGKEWRRAVVMKDASGLGAGDGREACFLSLYDVDTWQEYLEEAYQRMDPDESRFFMHTIVGDASTVDLDSANRVTLPERLLQYANIERQGVVKVVGALNHIEVWNPGVYETHLTAAEKEGVSVPSIADLARSRGIVKLG